MPFSLRPVPHLAKPLALAQSLSATGSSPSSFLARLLFCLLIYCPVICSICSAFLPLKTSFFRHLFFLSTLCYTAVTSFSVSDFLFAYILFCLISISFLSTRLRPTGDKRRLHIRGKFVLLLTRRRLSLNTLNEALAQIGRNMSGK